MKAPVAEEPVEGAADLVFQGVDFAKLTTPILRIRRLTRALFKAYDSDVRIVDGDRCWRSGEDVVRPSESFTASARVMAQNGAIWIADTAEDELTAHRITPDGPVRFYAGAPIRLEDGRCLGVLCVVDLEPRPYDADLAERLEDVAATLGHECDLARTMRDRDAAMERVERSERRVRLAVENAGMHVFELDFLKGEVFKTGPEEAFHESPRTFTDLSINILENVHPDDRESFRSSWSAANGVGIHQSEYRINRTDDKEIWVHTSTEMYRDGSGRPLRLVGAMQDITERKRSEAAMAEAKEAAEASNRAKSAFLATMSHEIRTPLNGVLGMAQAMAAEDLSETQRDRLKIIRESGEILLAILNDVLDLSKIEAGKLDLETIDFDLGEIARGAHAAFTALANRQGLAFEFDIEAARGVYRGDPTRLRQILYNLISNALKFTQEGEIRVTAKRIEGGLSITVSDTGVGIPADRLKTLFSKFSQVDASTTRRFGGTGLGLAICRELAELMGGGVAVSSAPGIGSDFTLTLPLLRVGDSEEAHSLQGDSPNLPGALAPMAALRVLAAEDNAVNQLVLKTLLAQIGVEPVLVANGRDAVQAWEDGDWDLVLMDVQMPEMDGLTATSLIRQRERETSRARTPVIALTANAMSHQIAAYFEAGMDGHIAKPIEARKLFQLIETVLAGQDDPPMKRAS